MHKCVLSIKASLSEEAIFEQIAKPMFTGPLIARLHGLSSMQGLTARHRRILLQCPPPLRSVLPFVDPVW